MKNKTKPALSSTTQMEGTMSRKQKVFKGGGDEPLYILNLRG